MFALRTCPLLLFLLLPSYLQAARILALFPIPSPSHYYYALPYLKSLAMKGHQVTSLNPYPQKQPMENFRDIPIPEVFDNLEEFLSRAIQTTSLWASNNICNEYCVNLTKAVLNNDQVRREILKPGAAQFDLIVMDLWRLDALYGLAGYFDAPIIGLAPYGTDWKIDELVGNTSPSSYLHLPTTTHAFPDRDTYFGRLNHFVERAVSWVNWRWKFLPKHEQIYGKYFGREAEKVSLSKIASNFALILVNQHFTLAPPRPYVPNMIEVVGLHIDDQQPKKLPKDMEDFIQGSGEAVLAHPKVKLFITHGGMLSTVESLHYGKPMLGLPCFFDQFRNMDHVQRMGLGLVLSHQEMTAADFKSALLRLLTEESFALNAKETSKRYRDQPMTSLAKANWWTEYILRHKGAAHMRVAGREMDFFTYHSLDVIGTLLGGALVCLVLIVALLWQLPRLAGLGQSKQKKLKNL
ncbi:UDP-glucuronosyltransferase 2B14-like [Drosophila madeirensis]|uniref:UDP-glucuronosyltransferase 2B14-like n=1 Tax=Drosophila madeirensis TaxID=30013 RepID=A0AAU9ETD4_DROMD